MLMERRAWPRVSVLADCSGLILVDVPSQGATGLLIDLSEEGLAIQFPVQVPELGTLNVKFSLGHRRVTGTCDAVWSSGGAYGLHFRALPQQVRAEIRSWVQEFQSTNELTP